MDFVNFKYDLRNICLSYEPLVHLVVFSSHNTGILKVVCILNQ